MLDTVDKLKGEAELSLVIGKRIRMAAKGDAMSYIAGCMTSQDVTARRGPWRIERPTNLGKSHNTFIPLGPFFVPAAFVHDSSQLRLTMHVNGERKQNGIVGDMVFSSADQIAFASSQMDLLPGDGNNTGTIGSVGHGTHTYLKHGDIVGAEVEGLDRQRNRVIFERELQVKKV